MVKKVNFALLSMLKRFYKGKSMLATIGPKNSYKKLVCGILSARARDNVTLPLCKILFKKYPNFKSLAKARSKDVEKIIKRIGFYRNKTKNIITTAKTIQKEYKGRVPKEKDKLLKLTGVGSKVANCVIVYAFQMPAIPVDTHVHRISNRLGWIKTKTPEKTEKALEKIVPERYWMQINEYFVLHGQNICLPQTPICSKCPIKKYCKKIDVNKSK